MVKVLQNPVVLVTVLTVIFSRKAFAALDWSEDKLPPALEKYVEACIRFSPIILDRPDVVAALAEGRSFSFCKYAKEVGTHCTKHLVMYQLLELPGRTLSVGGVHEALNMVSSSSSAGIFESFESNVELGNPRLAKVPLHKGATEKVICFYVNEYNLAEEIAFTLYKVANVQIGPAGRAIQDVIVSLKKDSDVLQFEKVMYTDISGENTLPKTVTNFANTSFEKLRREFKKLAKTFWSPVLHGEERISGRNVLVFQINENETPKSDETPQYVGVAFRSNDGHILAFSKIPSLESAPDFAKMTCEAQFSAWKAMEIVTGMPNNYIPAIEKYIKEKLGLESLKVLSVLKHDGEVLKDYNFNIIKTDTERLQYFTTVTHLPNTEDRFSIILSPHLTLSGAFMDAERYLENKLAWKKESNYKHKYTGSRKHLVDNFLAQAISATFKSDDSSSSTANKKIRGSSSSIQFSAGDWSCKLTHCSEFYKQIEHAFKKIYVFGFQFEKNGTTLYAAAMNKSKLALKSSSQGEREKLTAPGSVLRISQSVVNEFFLQHNSSTDGNLETSTSSKEGIPQVALTPFFEDIESLFEMCKRDFEVAYEQRKPDTDLILRKTMSLVEATNVTLAAGIQEHIKHSEETLLGENRIKLFTFQKLGVANPATLNFACEIQHGLDFGTTQYFLVDAATFSNFKTIMPFATRLTFYETILDAIVQKQYLVWKMNRKGNRAIDSDGILKNLIDGKYAAFKGDIMSSEKTVRVNLSQLIAKDKMLTVAVPEVREIWTKKMDGEIISQPKNLMCTSAFVMENKIIDVFVFEFGNPEEISKFSAAIVERNPSDKSTVAITAPLLFNALKILRQTKQNLMNLLQYPDNNETTTVWTLDTLIPKWASKFFSPNEQQKKLQKEELQKLFTYHKRTVPDMSEMKIVLNGMWGSGIGSERQRVFLIYQVLSSKNPEYLLCTVGQSNVIEVDFNMVFSLEIFENIEDAMDKASYDNEYSDVAQFQR